MIALKLAAAAALALGVICELTSWLPCPSGVAGNLGAALAVLLWTVATFARRPVDGRGGCDVETRR